MTPCIKAEANGGEIVVMPGTKDQKEHLVIGEKEYDDPDDPAVRARALEALDKLWRRGLVRHEGGIYVSLTGSGFDRAREAGGRIENG